MSRHTDSVVGPLDLHRGQCPYELRGQRVQSRCADSETERQDRGLKAALRQRADRVQHSQASRARTTFMLLCVRTLVL